MLTNFKTVKQSIKRLNELQLSLEDGSVDKITKKEALGIKKEYDKLERSIGGIKNMNSLPDAIFVIDVGYESGAVVEATKLGIPIMGVVDTNNSIDDIAYVIQVMMTQAEQLDSMQEVLQMRFLKGRRMPLMN